MKIPDLALSHWLYVKDLWTREWKAAIRACSMQPQWKEAQANQQEKERAT